PLPPPNINSLSLHDALPISTAWMWPTCALCSITAGSGVHLLLQVSASLLGLADANVEKEWVIKDRAPRGGCGCATDRIHPLTVLDRKSTRLNSSHQIISYAV